MNSLPCGIAEIETTMMASRGWGQQGWSEILSIVTKLKLEEISSGIMLYNMANTCAPYLSKNWKDIQSLSGERIQC